MQAKNLTPTVGEDTSSCAEENFFLRADARLSFDASLNCGRRLARACKASKTLSLLHREVHSQVLDTAKPSSPEGGDSKRSWTEIIVRLVRVLPTRICKLWTCVTVKGMCVRRQIDMDCLFHLEAQRWESAVAI